MPKKKANAKGRKETEIGKDISDAAKSGSLLIGSNSVFRELKKGNSQTVICASNLPASRMKELNHYRSVSGVQIKEFGGDSAKLGEACGKPFNILLICIKK